jgi:hypothetical protein
VDQRERLGESERLCLAMLTVQMRGEQKEMKQIKRRGTWKKKVGVGKLGELNTSSTLICQRTMARRAELEFIDISLSFTREKVIRVCNSLPRRKSLTRKI